MSAFISLGFASLNSTEATHAQFVEQSFTVCMYSGELGRSDGGLITVDAADQPLAFSKSSESSEMAGAAEESPGFETAE